jgi:hypothetical protein
LAIAGATLAGGAGLGYVVSEWLNPNSQVFDADTDSDTVTEIYSR